MALAFVPSLDPTIISQCSTVFAMRMSNDRDQALLRSAVSDTAANLFSYVPSLGTREALAFGAGVPLPTRLTFSELPEHLLPRSDTYAGAAMQEDNQVLNFIGSVVDRWRGATMNQKSALAEAAREQKLAAVTAASLAMPPAAPVAAPPAAPVPSAPVSAPVPAAAAMSPQDASRLSLLKKPPVDRPDAFGALRTPAPLWTGR